MKGIIQQMRECEEVKVWDKITKEDFKELLEKIIIKDKKRQKTMEIHKEGSEIPYIFIDELPVEEQEKFELWLFGSTAPLIGDGSRSTAYVSDYRRWKSCYF